MAIGRLSDSEQSTAILDLFPCQGDWRDGEYFSLPGNRMVELVRGRVEVLSVPSMLHQFIARSLFLLMNEFVERHGLGLVMSAPTRVKIDDRHYREPDVLFVANRNRRRQQEQYWEAIDLAAEIISPDDPDRDLVDKRRDYEKAEISEYWIIDPRNDSIQVNTLRNGVYEPFMSSRNAIASSIVLNGFELDVERLFRDARSATHGQTP